jgi:hypothetical protein
VSCAAVDGAGEEAVATEDELGADDGLVDPVAVRGRSPEQPVSTRTATIPERRRVEWARTG